MGFHRDDFTDNEDIINEDRQFIQKESLVFLHHFVYCFVPTQVRTHSPRS